MAYTTIDDPSAYFQIGLYTGNGNSGKNINLGSANYTGEYVGQDIQPDLVWIKKRSGGSARSHQLYDSSRGVTKLLHSDGTDIEQTQSAGLTAFGSNDFTLGNDDGVNGADHPYVSWNWKANGGTTSSNTDGDITTTVQANTTAAFSIITYTGNNGGGSTVGHGLGAVPDMLIAKSRIATKPWQCYHKSIGNDHFIDLDSTNAKVSASASWGNTTPTSSIVTLGNGDTNHTGAMVMYCFTSIQGYSKFGSYTGNGNADGTFVYTGFKPAWVMFKATTGTENWGIFDNQRNTQTGNPRDIYLMPSANNADSSESDSVDFLSNGFKWRIDSGFRNGNGVTFIYMAFAEHPFVSSKGVPTTAR